MYTPRRDFLKNVTICAAGLGLAPFVPDVILQDLGTGGLLPRSTPELEGISSQSILAFVESVEKNKLGLHSLMVVRHGKVVTSGWWDPYQPELRHMLFSLSKSFTSTAVGFAVAEGRLKVDDPVVSFFPEHLPGEPAKNLLSMRVKDLLTMTSGHDQDTMPPMRKASQSWVKTFLSLPVDHTPGSFFLYNSGATYMLSAIVQKLTGKTVLSYLKPRLLDPLEIKGADWETSPEGINAGAYGLRVKTEDIAKFGQFYLQRGVWKGKTLLPTAWVAEATSFQVPNVSLTAKNEKSDWQQGYGYQFWQCRHHVYRGDGAVGQYCIVMQEKDAVVAITSESANMQAILDAVWDYLLKGMKDGPLPKSAANEALLKQKMASLTLIPSKANSNSPVAVRISGKTFRLRENALQAASLSFAFAKDTCTFKLKDNTGEHQVTCGMGHWIKGETMMPGDPVQLVGTNNQQTAKAKVAAACVWLDDTTFEMTWMFYETPHSDTVSCRFEDNTIRLTFKHSLVGKMSNLKETRPVLEGNLTA